MTMLIRLLIAIPIAVAVIALAVINNQPVTISFDPLSPAEPIYAVTLPLYALFFAALLMGVLIGGGAVWFGQHRHRAAARASRREAARWREEAERSRAGGTPQGDGRGLRLIGNGDRAA